MYACRFSDTRQTLQWHLHQGGGIYIKERTEIII